MQKEKNICSHCKYSYVTRLKRCHMYVPGYFNETLQKWVYNQCFNYICKSCVTTCKRCKYILCKSCANLAVTVTTNKKRFKLCYTCFHFPYGSDRKEF